jgi:pimeloyl-ACP methyl ester carboxylesterase
MQKTTIPDSSKITEMFKSTLPDPGKISEMVTSLQSAVPNNTHEHVQHLTDLADINTTRAQRIAETTVEAWQKNQQRVSEIASAMMKPDLAKAYGDYLVDFFQRSVLYLDAMQQRSEDFLAHEEGRTDNVLLFDYEVIVDGATLDRPVNYSLVRIKPPEGTLVREDGRPYIIIDPRAGHGSGIGGFKEASEVGAAIEAGHPVYFAIFSRLPLPDQTIGDVTAAEAGFVREVQHRHPDSPKPIIIGNCQGGWAAMILAATNPDITGPVVANGAPLSYWGGVAGKNPMRYLGGIVGGVMPVMLMSDLTNGQFDGANLVYNFEKANPGRTWWKKYYDVFDRADTEVPRFLDFERWWGAYYFMNEDEIRWIVENLFVGNKLARSEALLDERTHIDLRRIQSPIIVFASHGDNITPPQQALGWIADNYKDVGEIKARGQRILYALHPSIGHLGIFVSSKIAQKEHTAIVSTLKAIEALAPGLYELTIKDVVGEGVEKQFNVAFEERTIEQMMQQAGGTDDPRPFATVARLSELGAETYDLMVRPFVKSMVTPQSADFLNKLQPLRMQRYLTSEYNPWMQSVPTWAEQVREKRQPVDGTNPFRQMEKATADMVTHWWDGVRDLQELWMESTFHWLYATPHAKAIGEKRSRRISDAPQEDLRSLVEVQEALDRMDEGGFAEGVVRMLILLARSRGEVRRSRLERSNEVLERTEPWASMKPKHRTRLIHRESLIVAFEPVAALAGLPKLIHTAEQRERALGICHEIAGPTEEMSKATVDTLKQIEGVLADAPVVGSPPPVSTKGNGSKRRTGTTG